MSAMTMGAGGMGAAGGLAAAAAGGGAGGGALGGSGGTDVLMKEANRFIGYLGQVAGIGVSGLLETFGLNDSPIADPSKSLIGRIAGGLMGAHPASPNTAGATAPPLKPEEKPQADPKAGALGAAPLVHIENQNVNNADGGDAARATARELMPMSVGGR
jgi:hypothetical protein